MNLNGILIGSENPAALTAYYTKVFGDPGWKGDEFTGWQIGSGWMAVGPHDQVKGRNAHSGRLIWNIETSDVQGEFERLNAAGATVVREPYKPDGRRRIDCHFLRPRRKLLPAHQPDVAARRKRTIRSIPRQ